MNKLIIYLLSLSVLLILSCNQHDHSHDDHDHDHSHDEAEHNDHEHEDGQIHLSAEQVKTMDIQFGEFSQIKIDDFIRITGTLGLPPNAMTAVSAKSEGFIKNSNKYVEGSYLQRGSIIAYLENPAFISMQQDYLEVNAELNYLRSELSRQKTLFDSNAGIEKNVQKLEADVAMKEARVQGLTKQMKYLGINVEKVTADNIIQRVAIYAPMSGFVTSISLHNGMFVKPEQKLLEIVNEDHLHLELDVFEKDIAHVKEEQKISYSVPALGSEIFEGRVHVIGKEFNSDNKTVRVHGHLEGKRPTFIKDLFLEGKIWLTDQTVEAVPEDAIIRSGEYSYLYITNGNLMNDEYEFLAIRVIPGNTDKGFTAVKLIDPIPSEMKIVTHGAFYVYAQSQAGELKHEH